MNPATYVSDNQIKQLGFDALKRELGIAGFIRFMQQFEVGHGNYAIDRDEWQKDYDIDAIAREIAKRRPK
jgi:hypothetical protein